MRRARARCAESEADSEQLAEERRDEFFREISDTVKSRLAEELEVDKLILEVKSLKLSCEPGHICVRAHAMRYYHSRQGGRRHSSV